mmetsp:Transcript_5684/g.8481  ORF Transcript_5684/g.8481 Transcript_5684/m.8481 type:complete len:126 (+) Transcript_5684:1299-1676(+)
MGAKVSKMVTRHIYRRSLRVTDHRGGTPLHCACLAAQYDVTAMLWTNGIQLHQQGQGIWMGICSFSYFSRTSMTIMIKRVTSTCSIFLLLRANPEIEIWMNGTIRTAGKLTRSWDDLPIEVFRSI